MPLPVAGDTSVEMTVATGVTAGVTSAVTGELVFTTASTTGVTTAVTGEVALETAPTSSAFDVSKHSAGAKARLVIVMQDKRLQTSMSCEQL